MKTLHKSTTVALDAEFGHADITAELRSWVREARVETGIACVSVVGSTGGVTTIEYEPGALEDLARALERIAPSNGHYEHNARWGDGNGFSHLRSALVKTGLSIPIVGGDLRLGTWQQVLVVSFDNRPRRREVVGVILGE